MVQKSKSGVANLGVNKYQGNPTNFAHSFQASGGTRSVVPAPPAAAGMSSASAKRAETQDTVAAAGVAQPAASAVAPGAETAPPDHTALAARVHGAGAETTPPDHAALAARVGAACAETTPPGHTALPADIAGAGAETAPPGRTALAADIARAGAKTAPPDHTALPARVGGAGAGTTPPDHTALPANIAGAGAKTAPQDRTALAADIAGAGASAVALAANTAPADSAACIGPGGSSAKAVDSGAGDVLVSVASESTGKAQTCRNELFALFGIWIGWADKSLPKNAWEEQDKALRNEARKLYVGELIKRGVTVAYQRFANGTQSVTVSWDGVKMEREVKNDGRNAARNTFVALLRKRVETQMMHVTTWPIPDRPQTDPRNGEAVLCLAKPDGADVASAHASGVYRPGPSRASASAKSKSSVAHRARLPTVGSGNGATDCVGGVKQSQQPACGGASSYAASSASSTEAHMSQVLAEILAHAGGRERAGSDARESVQGAMDDAGIEQQGPDSVALLFATDADVRNGAVWEQWLARAPPKSCTVYVHAQHPDRVITPLFKDSLVNEHAFVPTVPLGGEPAVGGTGVDMHGASTSKSSAPMEHNRGDGQSGDADAQKPIHSIMVLLKEALKEPSNKWFMVLDDACLPMVAFDTFFKHMALHPTKSIFDFHPEKVHRDMLSVLQFVTGVPALVRGAINNNDLVAHSPIGTMLVRRDAEMLANAPSAVLREWERALSSGPLQDALFSPHGAQYFGNCLQLEPTEQEATLPLEDASDLIEDFFGGVAVAADEPARASQPGQREHSQGRTSVPGAGSLQAPQSLWRSLCLSVDELFLFALLRHLSRLKHGEPQAHKEVVRV